MRSAVLMVGALASILLNPVAAGAQATATTVNTMPLSPPAALPYPAISTTATATRDFVPDIAHVVVSLAATASNAVAALAAIRTKEQTVRDAVAPLVPTVSGLAVQYDRGSGASGPHVTVTETLATQVDVARVGATVDVLRRFGPALGVSFDTTRHEQLYREALAEATSLAYGRAVTIAAAAKAEIDRVTFVDGGAGAQLLDAQNTLLDRVQAGPFAVLSGLPGSLPPASIRATAIVTVRLR